MRLDGAGPRVFAGRIAAPPRGATWISRGHRRPRRRNPRRRDKSRLLLRRDRAESGTDRHLAPVTNRRRPRIRSARRRARAERRGGPRGALRVRVGRTRGPELQPAARNASAGGCASTDGSRRRRGCDVDIPWRRARRRRGYSVETSRGAAAAATWIVRGDESQRRRGCDVDIPWRLARHQMGPPQATRA